MHFSDPGRVMLVPLDYCARLDLESGFGRTAPLEVDIGSGDGAFLLESARRHPERNFLGIERLLGRARATCHVAARSGLTNVRILRLDSAYAVRWLLPAASVNTFHLACPDPWPKRRHRTRRVFRAAFLRAILAALEDRGALRVVSDHALYFSRMMRLCRACTDLEEIPGADDPRYPVTDFERYFLARNAPVYRALFSKISRNRNGVAE
jgi:tRNA (guanine-N7-)-methyltransferase